MQGTRTHSIGFTIVELMVTIGITGILISILFPALANAKSRAGEIKSLSNARGIAMSMQAYADSFGNYPFAKVGDIPPGIEYPDSIPPGMMAVPRWPDGYIFTVNPWSLNRLWPGLVAQVAPWEENFETWVSPGRANPTLYDDHGKPTTGAVSYRYSNSFVGSPALWREGSVADGSLIVPTTPGMVDYPSNKVLVWDGDLAYLPRQSQNVIVVDGVAVHLTDVSNHITPMAFADQHAEMRNPLDAAPGVPNPLNNNSDTRLHNTPAGVLGRDY